jgi:hypothetical protein
MMFRLQGIVIAVWAASWLTPVLGGEITPAGRTLASRLDAMNVENLWLASQSVNWKTGEPLAKPVIDGKAHTHCSAFVASTCQRLGVYILRPPDHSTVLLANAQYDWLRAQGAALGWTPVKDGARAQALANSGTLVVAAFREADPAKPGHVAIVRPSTKDLQKIIEHGPQIIQAGMTNYRSTSLAVGFKHHKSAWPNRVRYYAHGLDLEK